MMYARVLSAPPPLHTLTHVHSILQDAFAILLALHHPSLHLLGVSTVHGNSSLACTTSNAQRLLTAFGRPDFPVHAGASAPFCCLTVHAREIHGESGLDGTNLLPAARQLPDGAREVRKPAALAMRD